MEMKNQIAVAMSDHEAAAPIGPFRQQSSRSGRRTTTGVARKGVAWRAWDPWTSRFRLPVVALTAVLLAVLLPAAASAAITEFQIPTANSYPLRIAAGSDAALWFTDYGTAKIGRMTTSGSFSEFAVPTPYPVGITAGPDGALWFTETINSASKIARITTSGTFSEFATPTPASHPWGITAGPDGALWFTEAGTTRGAGAKIGRITTAGGISEFAIPTPGGAPTEITAGPDGALWFTELEGNKIGRITTAGSVSEFAIPSTCCDAGTSDPRGITSGPDGALWFTEEGGNKIGRITTAGSISEFAIPTFQNTEPQVITAGPDGALWFTEEAGNKIGRITTAGSMSEFPIPTANSHPRGITLGPDAALWFTEGSGNKIGRITPGPGPPASLVLSSKTSTNTVGTQHCVTATVKDASGNPTPNISVVFSVSGSVNTRGTQTTDTSGNAQFCYQGPQLPGQDLIKAFADTNNNGSQDPGEPFDTATKTWVLPVSTPGCATLITNGGWIIANNLDQASLGGNAQVPSSGPPEGQEQYTDHGPVAGMDVHSLNVLSVVCNSDNTQADIYGQATINQAGSHYYRISVADPDPTGGADRYRIILDTGYDSGDHALGGGTIEIHR
jgi:virginiamycin B lyase